VARKEILSEGNLTDFQERFHLVEGRCNRGTSNKYAEYRLTNDQDKSLDTSTEDDGY